MVSDYRTGVEAMKALILTNLQNDFIDGVLSISKAEEVIPIANRLITSCCFDLIVAIQEFHPPGHCSFASSHPDITDGSTLQPEHCIWNTHGSAFHEDLLIGRVNLILRLGGKIDVDCYSGFIDQATHLTGLSGYLKDNGVNEVWLTGLSHRGFMGKTASTSASMGFDTRLIVEGCRGVNKSEVEEAVKYGVKVATEKEAYQ